MSITRFMKGAMAQTLVYWGTPVNDGYGRYTFGTPVELDCRWESAKELVKDANGEEVLSRAQAWVDVDVEEQGYMWLGTMTDSGYNADPLLLDDAMQIIAFGKIPRLRSTTEFERKAYLNIRSTQNV